MGLDTSHDCWHGPYSSFNQFRVAIAMAAGLPPLMEMQGYRWGTIPWESLKPDVIHKLLNHSDCDGEIESADCAPLADRMESILPNIQDEYCFDKATQFIAGLRLAASKNENVIFQ